MYTTIISFVINLFSNNKDSDKNGFDVRTIIFLVIFIFVVLPLLYFSYTSIKDSIKYIFNIKTDKEIIIEKKNEIDNLKRYNTKVIENLKKEKVINKANEEAIEDYYEDVKSIDKKEQELKDKVIHPPDISYHNDTKIKHKEHIVTLIPENRNSENEIVIDKQLYVEEGAKNIDALWDMYDFTEGLNNEK